MQERISQLKEEIKNQEELNISLYNLFMSMQLSDEDEINKKAQIIRSQWYDGSGKIKALMKEMNELKDRLRDQKECKAEKVFINGYGEATNREITTVSYNNYQKRLNKEILSFMGNR